ncbi:MAG: phytase [Deltaproteobacteria bacterium]|nr:phytase [Deltaproteobacteria bacterium]
MGSRAAKSASLLLAVCVLAPTSARPATVVATAETTPVPISGNADDPAIWVHPSNPSQSVVIGTDKLSGVVVYNLAGTELQVRSDGRLNNVDVRYRFPLEGGLVDIAAASNRTDNKIAVYEIDASTGLLTPIAVGGGIQTGLTVYGFCLYASPAGAYYAFVTSKQGDIEQWKLLDDGSGLVTGTLVRSFDVGGTTEGCVADDVQRALYVGEEDVAIWRYGAEPQDGETRTLVDSNGGNGHLVADIEGLTLFYRDAKTGYLVASSQGDHSFAIYERESGNAYVGRFSIVAGAIDGVTGTDGIDVVNRPLGPGMAWGVFVAQDGNNDEGSQNFKLVPWADIALAFDPPLEFMSTWDPRTPVAVPALTLRSRAILVLLLLTAICWLAAARPRGSPRPGI